MLSSVRWSEVRRRTIIVGTLAYLGILAVEAPIRYLLVLQGWGVAIYAKDALLVSLLCLGFASARLSKAYLILLTTLLVFSIVGLLTIERPAQVLFGLKILLPLALGVLAFQAASKAWPPIRWENAWTFLMALWAIVCLGVLLNAFISFPWEGLTYSLGSFSVAGTRQWFTTGVRLERLAGFSRASFDAASHALLLGIVLVSFRGSRPVRTAIWLLSGVTILLTTTKGVLLAYLIITAFFLTRRLLPSRTWILVAVAIAMLSVALPVSSAVFDYDFQADRGFQRLAFGSVAERMEVVWRDGLALTHERGAALLGRGIGGIGTAQKYFERSLYNPADNLFVYLYSAFGVLSVGYLSFLLWRIRLIRYNRSTLDMCVHAVFLTAVTYGLTTSILENPYFAVFMGAVIAHLHSLRRREAVDSARPMRFAANASPPS